ncbi:PKD domain-containing protein [Chitinophaga solisilvae]|uniref:PKD domain-containing protein n=1 Tax=Chitinophaga solisilvae TaxID=1233460 RepID=UPI00136F1D32|nr:PKD domain-containing protein [Chitinophaga solisilvae]
MIQLYARHGLSRLILFILIPLLCYRTATAQQVARTLPTGFNNIAGYYEYLPPDYHTNPNKRFPVIIFIHGVGELAGSNLSKPLSEVLKNGLPNYIQQGRFPATFKSGGSTNSFIVLSPQFKVWPGSGDVHKLLAYAESIYRVDSGRVYVTGLSMGGGVAWGAITEGGAKSAQYAAAVMVCGAYDPNASYAKPAVIAANNLPVWALHNDKDPSVPVKYSRDWVAKINAIQPPIKVPAKLTIFRQDGHNAWSQAYDPNFKDPVTGLNIYEWMLQYRIDSLAAGIPTPVTGGKRITVPVTSPGQIYYDDVMTSLKVQPGDTLCIPAGDYNFIQLGKITGTADKPVVITNCGGLVRVGVNCPSTAAAFVLSTCKYFKLEGNGTPGLTYGFDVNGTNKDGAPLFGLFIGNGSTDMDIHHIYIHDAGMFLQAKTLQSCSRPEYWEGRFVMRNVKLHHLLCRNAAWEGFYIGNTHYLWDDANCKDMPSHHIENLEVYANDLENMGSDGIQVAMADMGSNSVHDNRLVNYAMARNSAHGYGILCGGRSKLKIYNNTIDHGFNPGIQIFGTGQNDVFNNLITNIEYEGIGVADKETAVTPPAAFIYNNTIVNTGPNGMKIYASLTTTGHRIYNNIVVAEGTSWDAPQSGYYIKGPAPVKFDFRNNLSFKTIADAGFVNAAAGNYRPAGASAAVDAGRSMTDLNLTADLEGSRRPQGTAFDAGAYEYNGTGKNIAPAANAGKDQSIWPPATGVQLNGSASADPDGTITSYSWKKISGPGAVNISNAAIAQPGVTGLVTGSYIFALTVTDNEGLSSTDDVTITVLAKPNQPPVAAAGNDVTLTLPVSATLLTGSNSLDRDGLITTYAWKQLSGPNTAVIARTDVSNTGVSGFIAGTYIFELTVTDNLGLTGTARVAITVKAAAGPNQPPVANAGPTRTVTLPLSAASLDGTASFDPDGAIVSYAWSQTQGPSTGTITGAGQATAEVSGLKAGIYLFKLTVTDNGGLSNSASTSIVVKDPVDVRPHDSASVDLYPNRISGGQPVKLVITHPETKNVFISVYDLKGTREMHISRPLNGSLTEILDLGPLGSGVHLIQVRGDNGYKWTGRLIKL